MEKPKTLLCIRGKKTNELVFNTLKDLHKLKKPHCRLFSRKNDVRPFEDSESTEFLCNKNDSAIFAVASHTKKRPQNLVIGRIFNSSVLDMFEFTVENFISLSAFSHKVMSGGKFCLLFEGSEFEHDTNFFAVKNVLLDLFRGEDVDRINLAGLDRIIVSTVVNSVTASNPKLYLRCYTTAYYRADGGCPRVELLPTGPNIDLALRRTKCADKSAMKSALQRPAHLARRTKNIGRQMSNNEKIGRLHVDKQDLNKIQTRKVKGLKRKRD